MPTHPGSPRLGQHPRSSSALPPAATPHESNPEFTSSFMESNQSLHLSQHRHGHDLCTPQDKKSLVGKRKPISREQLRVPTHPTALNQPPRLHPWLVPPSVLLSSAGNPISPRSNPSISKAGKKVVGKDKATPHETDASSRKGTRSRQALSTQAKSLQHVFLTG